MDRCKKWCLVVLALVVSVAWAQANEPRRIDLTKRQSQIADKQIPIKKADLKMNQQIGGKRIPIKRWHGEFNPIGQRRASIDVRETREKNIIRPELIEMEKNDLLMSPVSGRRAYVRNFDNVRENKLVEQYRDADVVTVREVSVPAPSNNEAELSMQDLNRFSFRRNNSTSGSAEVQRPGSESEKR